MTNKDELKLIIDKIDQHIIEIDKFRKQIRLDYPDLFEETSKNDAMPTPYERYRIGLQPRNSHLTAMVIDQAIQAIKESEKSENFLTKLIRNIRNKSCLPIGTELRTEK